MTDSQATTYSEYPTLAKQVADRMNAAFATIAQGQLMQNSRPFEVAMTSSGSVVIAFVCSPRDCEIAASIFEKIERGDYEVAPITLPGPGQQQLDV